MIGSLTGRLLEKSPAEILLEVSGVGYRVAVPLTTYEKLPEPGSTVTLSVHTHVREDVLALYGFDSRRERDLFERLITVPGIGPRLGLAIHSHLGPANLVAAVRGRDPSRLIRVPGVGRKTAERLLLEMESMIDKIEVAAFGEARGVPAGPRADLLSALEGLGYRASQVEPVLDVLLAGDGAKSPVETLLREALRRLGGSAPARTPGGDGRRHAPGRQGRARRRSAS